MESGPILLYASQTGNAKSVAECINMEDMASIYGKEIRMMSLQSWLKDDKDLQKFAQLSDVILVCSTCGQGDVPDNGIGFLRVLKKVCKDGDYVASLPFQHVNLYCLGLGDTNYDKFCGGLKILERHLSLLGAKKAMKTVYADDGVDLEKGVNSFRSELTKLQKSQNITEADKSVSVDASDNTVGSVDTGIVDIPQISSFVREKEEIKCSDEPLLQLLPRHIPVDIIRPAQVLKNPAARLTPLFQKNAPVILDNLKQGLNTPITRLPNGYIVGTASEGVLGSSTVLNQYLVYKEMLKEAQGLVDSSCTDLGYTKEHPLFAPVEMKHSTGQNVLNLPERSFLTIKLDLTEIKPLYKDDVYIAGDCITVFPTNSSDLIDFVECMWRLQDYEGCPLFLTSEVLDTNVLSEVSVAEAMNLPGLTPQHEHLPRQATLQSMLSSNLQRYPYTLRDLQLYSIDQHAPLKRSVLRPLVESCTHPFDLAKGLYIYSKAKKDLLEEFITAKPSINDLITLFPSLGGNQGVLIQSLLDYGAPIIPRSYSLTSSPASDTLEICMRVHRGDSVTLPNICTVDYENAPVKRAATYMSTGKRTYEGLCGHWQKLVYEKSTSIKDKAFSTFEDLGARGMIEGVLLKYSLHPFLKGQSIPCTVQGNPIYVQYQLPFCFHASPQFYLPLSEAKTEHAGLWPLLLVGVGTGITPLLGFIRHKFALLMTKMRENPHSNCPYVLQSSCFQTSFDQNINKVVDFADTDSILQNFSNITVKMNQAGALVLENTMYSKGEYTLPDVGVGSIHVYTGNTHRNLDVLYLQELVVYCEMGVISTLAIAASRENTTNIQIQHPSHEIVNIGSNSKIYADDLLSYYSTSIASLIAHGGEIFLCGGANGLVKSVQVVLERTLQQALQSPILENVYTPKGMKTINFIDCFQAYKHNPALRNAVWNSDGTYTLDSDANTKTSVLDVFTNTTYDKAIQQGLSTPSSVDAIQWGKYVLTRMIAENKYKRDLWS